MPIFQEVQTFELWVWCVVIIAGGLLPLGLSFMPGLPPWTRRMLRSLIVILPGAMLLFAGIMRTEVTSSTLTVHFGFTPYQRYTVERSAIDSIRVRSYSGVSEYGGWGIKRGASGLSYTMRGDSGVQLVIRTTEGPKRLLIGSPQPSVLARALASH